MAPSGHGCQEGLSMPSYCFVAVFLKFPQKLRATAKTADSARVLLGLYCDVIIILLRFLKDFNMIVRLPRTS